MINERLLKFYRDLEKQKMKIKICGLFQEADIDYVNEAKPDYIGFVFAKSKRQVDYHQAKLLKSKLDSTIKAVGVFVDSDIDKIIDLVNDKIIDIVQLHGSETSQYIKKLKQHIDVPVIKAIKVTGSKDLNDLDYPVDYYLLDNQTSGSGKAFDWSLIKELDKPFFLAGGIDLNNLDEAISKAGYGIDVSSGVETNGVKDHNKIMEMVRRTRDGNR